MAINFAAKYYLSIKSGRIERDDKIGKWGG